MSLVALAEHSKHMKDRTVKTAKLNHSDMAHSPVEGLNSDKSSWPTALPECLAVPPIYLLLWRAA